MTISELLVDYLVTQVKGGITQGNSVAAFWLAIPCGKNRVGNKAGNKEAARNNRPMRGRE